MKNLFDSRILKGDNEYKVKRGKKRESMSIYKYK